MNVFGCWIGSRLAATLVVASLGLTACQRGSTAPEPPPVAIGHVTAAGVERVDPKKVCMVNNHFMGSDQAPVVVESKTYFSCCAMCETRLKQEPPSRFGKDPVSGRDVDKASAVIGKLPDGRVIYFESEKTLLSYAPAS